MRLSIVLLCLFALPLQAANISVIGLFPGKAVLVIDDRSPKTYAVGANVTTDTKLVDVNQTTATFESGGKKQRIEIGGHLNKATPSATSRVTLKADERGHFLVQGQVNGGTIRMMVDTGASVISMPATDAKRVGVDYKKGKTVLVNTANGTAPAYMVTFDTVKVGDIVLNQVEGLVQENGLPFTLLGMSFLKRMEMRRDGDEMVLTKRY